MDARLQRLIAAHLLLAAAPMGSLLFEPSLPWMPLFWALQAIPVGSLLAVAFWLGIGPQRWIWRALLALAAVCYVSFWQSLMMLLQHLRYQNAEPIVWTDWLANYASTTAMFAIMVLLFGGILSSIRHRCQLALTIEESEPTTTGRWQISILNLLAIMTALAVLCMLITASRSGEWNGTAGGLWPLIASYLLGFGGFFSNMLYSATATLRPGPIRGHVTVATLVALALGVAMSFASRQDTVAWWLVAGGAVIGLVPAVTVIASLLVVRVAGYRLVSRRHVLDVESRN